MKIPILPLTVWMALCALNSLYAATICDLTQCSPSLVRNVANDDLAKVFGLEEQADLKVRQQVKSRKLGMIITRYDQYYCGRKVADADILITKKPNGAILFLKGQVVRGIAADLSLLALEKKENEILKIAQNRYTASKNNCTGYIFKDEKVSEEILVKDGKAMQVYHVRFFADRKQGLADPSEVEFFFKIPELTTVQNFTFLRTASALPTRDNERVKGKGPGGNEKVGCHEHSNLPCKKIGDLYVMSSYTNTYDMNHATSGGPFILSSRIEILISPSMAPIAR